MWCEENWRTSWREPGEPDVSTPLFLPKLAEVLCAPLVGWQSLDWEKKLHDYFLI